MLSPNIWVGLGQYGALTLNDMAQRQALLELFGPPADASVPLLCHVPLDPDACEVHHTRVACVPEGLTGDGESMVRAAQLHYSSLIRRGNHRGDAYVFVLAHLQELAASRELLCGQPAHWLWNFANLQMGFQGTQVVLILDMTRSTVLRGTGSMQREALEAIRDGLEYAAQQYGLRYRILLLDATNLYDPNNPTPSRDAVSLLFEMLSSLRVDPGADDATRALLIETDFDHTPFATFGINAAGVNIATQADHATLELGKALLEDIDRPHVDDITPSRALPAFDVPLPYVPDEIAELTFQFKPQFWQTASDSRRSLDAEEGRLLATLPDWWARAMRADLIDTSEARTAAGKALDTARAWMNHELNDLWAARSATATQIADVITSMRRDVRAREAAGAKQQVGRIAEPNFSGVINDLRGAIDVRPAAGLAIAIVACVALAGGIAAYAAATWASAQIDALQFLADLRLFAGLAGGLLLGCIGYLNWVQQPWSDVTAADEKVRQRMAVARQSAKTFRSTVARYVASTLQSEIALSLGTTLDMAEAEFRRLSAAVTAGFDDRERIPKPAENFFESLDLALRDGVLPAKHDLALRFREGFLPHSYEGTGGRPVQFEPERIAGVVAGFVSSHLMRSIASQPLIDVSHVAMDPQLGVLVANVQPTLRRIYTPSRGTPPPANGANSEITPLLARPDKTYGLAVAASFALDEVFR